MLNFEPMRVCALMRGKSGEAVVFGVSGVVLIYEYHRTRDGAGCWSGRALKPCSSP